MQPPKRFIFLLMAMSALALFGNTAFADMPAASSTRAGDLTLAEALELAVGKSPVLAAARHRVEAADARVVQAGLWSNPELEFEIENFGGGGENRGFESAESTVVISQSLQLGGKIKRGREVAESDYAIAGRSWASAELDVRARTSAAFYSVLAAQERLRLGGELLDLARSFADTVDARVEAGKVSPVEGTRARMEVASVRVSLIRASRELEVTRVRLSAMWGASAPDFRRALGELPRPIDRPSVSQLQNLVRQTPDMLALDDRLHRSGRVVALENSFKIPDLTVAAGPRRFSETGHNAWVAGISLPIPIFDRNQGARRGAEFDLESTRRDVQAVKIEIEAGLVSVVQRLDAAEQVTTSLDAEVVPAARGVLRAVEIGYTEGKFGFLDVIDAQRTLFEARSILLDSAEEYALARVDLERLIGRNLGAAEMKTSSAELGE